MAIVIDLKSTDSQVEQRLDRVIAQLDVLNAQLVKARNNWRAMASATQMPAVRSSAPRSARTGGRVAAPPTHPMSVLSDPNIRAALLQGDPWAAAATNKAVSQMRGVTRAQKAVTPTQQPTFAQNFQSMLMRSRYGGGSGGGAMPLGMDVAKLFGGGLKGGGIALALTGAVALIVASFKRASDSAREFSEAMVGGGAQGAGAAVVLGAVTGTGPGGAASAVRGRGMRETAFGASRGINPLAGDPFYDPGGGNKAYLMMADIVSKVADKSGFSAAQAEAARLGAPELAKLGLLSKGTRESVMGASKREGNPFADSAFADLWAEISLFAKEFAVLVKTNMTPAVKLAAQLFAWLRTLLEWLNDMLKKMFAWTGAFGDLDKKLGDQNNAMSEHTRAMREHSGYLGGDRRARGAVPESVKGNPAVWFDRDALRQSVRLGALV